MKSNEKYKFPIMNYITLSRKSKRVKDKRCRNERNENKDIRGVLSEAGGVRVKAENKKKKVDVRYKIPYLLKKRGEYDV